MLIQPFQKQTALSLFSRKSDSLAGLAIQNPLSVILISKNKRKKCNFKMPIKKPSFVGFYLKDADL